MRKSLIALALIACVGGGPPPKIVKCTMTADGVLDVFLEGNRMNIAFPHVLVFDKDGGLVYTTEGYGLGTARDIRRAAHRHARQGAARLETYAANLKRDDGKLLDAATLKGTPTVIQIGADWCKPCHMLEADLRHVNGITLILADGDLQKRQGELQTALEKRFHR